MMPTARTRRLRRLSAAKPPAATSRPWREDTFIVIDLETTGLDLRRDHIVSYGAVPVRQGRVIAAEAVYGLVHVGRTVPAESSKCHRIRTQDLTGAPPLSDCVERLDALIGGHVVVAHCAWIERAFLRRAFRESYLPFTNPIVDTAVMARKLMPSDAGADDAGRAISLEFAATTLHLPVHSPHHALGDALTTAGLFIALAGRLDTGRDLTTATLISKGQL